MVNLEYKTAEEMNIKLQQLKDKTKLRFNQNFSNCYDEMKYRRQSGFFQL